MITTQIRRSHAGYTVYAAGLALTSRPTAAQAERLAKLVRTGEDDGSESAQVARQIRDYLVDEFDLDLTDPTVVDHVPGAGFHMEIR